MRTLGLLVVILAAARPQDNSPQIPKEPIRDWKYMRKDLRRNPKTNEDVEEITLILKGKEAVPRTPIAGKERFEVVDLRGVDARYFTTPRKESEKSKEILVLADRGLLDNLKHTLKLDDHVRVVRKNDDEVPPQDDTVLLASSLLLRFVKAYECPKPNCRRLLPAPGRCPDHGVPLNETTITSVE